MKLQDSKSHTLVNLTTSDGKIRGEGIRGSEARTTQKIGHFLRIVILFPSSKN